jgi:hypothetical protein
MLLTISEADAWPRPAQRVIGQFAVLCHEHKGVQVVQEVINDHSV